MQFNSTITCPKCGHQAIETMPTDACQFLYGWGKGATSGLSLSRATVACFAPTGRCHRSSSRQGIAAAWPPGDLNM